MRNKKKNIILLIVLGILFLVLAVIGVFLIKNATEKKAYRAHLNEGQKYLEELKYEEAVASFEFAIEKDPKSENAYIGIFQARDAQGEYLMAAEILQKGYANTRSDRIDLLLANYLEKHPSGSDGEQSTETAGGIELLAEESQKITINTAFMQKIANYTYQDYQREFGNCVSHEMKSGVLEIKHAKLAGTFYYRDIDEEDNSIDVKSSFPYKDAKPAYIRLDNVELLFRGFGSGITYTRLREIARGQVECTDNEKNEKKEEGITIVKFSYKECGIQIQSDKDGNIIKSAAWNKIIPPRPDREAEKGVYQGVIVDATTGQGLQGADVRFMPRDRSQETVRVQSDGEGAYKAELPEGTYDVEVSKEGFIQDSFDLEITAEEQQSGDSFPLSPKLAQGEIRIVLTWGAYPTDLDSHLDGTTTDGHSVYVYFARSISRYGNSTAAQLDVDDRNGYGPETTTIYADGSYRFRVNDFTRSGEISASGAEVKIYLPDQSQPTVFQVPDGVGNLWDVCQIENGKITPINSIE
nr:carboxypeptidase regulatory-like domain-containing protein [uncultured Blautia sp.]